MPIRHVLFKWFQTSLLKSQPLVGKLLNTWVLETFLSSLDIFREGVKVQICGPPPVGLI